MERASRTLVVVALLILLAHPARWLARTWVEPSYDSSGGLVALLVAALIARSVLSGPAPAHPSARTLAWALFGAAATARLAGRVLSIDHVGALALVADVAALALYLRLHARPWPVHPGALAGLFALSLPTEQLLQHVLGHPLRLASAALAAALATPLVPGLDRQGTLLLLPTGALHVDLPCSGAQGLFLFGVLAWTTATVRVVGPVGAVAGTAAVLASALGANTLRLLALILGPTEALLHEPAHSAVGLVALAIGAVPVLAVARILPPRTPVVPAAPSAPRAALPLPLAVALVLGAVLLTRAPRNPLDTSDALDLTLPLQVGDAIGQPVTLSAQELAYFGQYGGAVHRVEYATPDGARVSALLVATTAPVRHLHGAELCLKGAGHEVTREGVRNLPVATTEYRTVDPDGRVWRVRSTLASTDGAIVETPSEVVWRWMAHGGAWMRIERVTPWSWCATDPAACDAFDRALLTALDVPVPLTRIPQEES